MNTHSNHPSLNMMGAIARYSKDQDQIMAPSVSVKDRPDDRSIEWWWAQGSPFIWEIDEESDPYVVLQDSGHGYTAILKKLPTGEYKVVKLSNRSIVAFEDIVVLDREFSSVARRIWRQ